MSVTIKRNTGWLGMGTRITVKLDGEKVAKIGYGEKIEVDLPDHSAQLKVSQTGSKSNKVEVVNGDAVEITTTKQVYLIWFLAVFSPLFLNIFTDRFRLPFIVIIFIIISAFLVDSFHLAVLNRGSR